MYICEYDIYDIYAYIYVCKLYKHLEAFGNEHNETLINTMEIPTYVERKKVSFGKVIPDYF